MEEKPKRNPDSEDLGYCGNDRIIVGYVDEVNGPGAVEVPGFVPTGHELIQLVKYWATVAIEIEFDCFLYQQMGSTEMRLGPFANRRILRIATVLGDEETAKAVKEAEDEFGKGCDPGVWRIFREGTPEEISAFQGEVMRSICGTDEGTEI